MDQESRWYSMFKRLYQNFMKIRITLTAQTEMELVGVMSPNATPGHVRKLSIEEV